MHAESEPTTDECTATNETAMHHRPSSETRVDASNDSDEASAALINSSMELESQAGDQPNVEPAKDTAVKPRSKELLPPTDHMYLLRSLARAQQQASNQKQLKDSAEPKAEKAQAALPLHLTLMNFMNISNHTQASLSEETLSTPQPEPSIPRSIPLMRAASDSLDVSPTASEQLSTLHNHNHKIHTYRYPPLAPSTSPFTHSSGKGQAISQTAGATLVAHAWLPSMFKASRI